MTEKESAALLMCLKLHAAQLDKGGQPYAAHPIRVAFSLWQRTSEDLFIAALLHDVVEDCGVSLDDLEARFGKRVRDAVDGVSRRKNETYMEFITRCKLNGLSRRIKLADIEDNMRPERIACLPESERSISRRYIKAKAYLEAQP